MMIIIRSGDRIPNTVKPLIMDTPLIRTPSIKDKRFGTKWFDSVNEPLKKGHPVIKDKNFGTKGVLYSGVSLYRGGVASE